MTFLDSAKVVFKQAVESPHSSMAGAIGLLTVAGVSKIVANRKNERHMQEQIERGEEPTKRSGFAPNVHKFARAAAVTGAMYLGTHAVGGALGKEWAKPSLDGAIAEPVMSFVERLNLSRAAKSQAAGIV